MNEKGILPLAAPLKSSHNKVPDITQIFDIHFLKTASESLFSPYKKWQNLLGVQDEEEMSKTNV
jgi:hypothetical protein